MMSPGKVPNPNPKPAPGPAKGTTPVASLSLSKFLYFDFYFTIMFFVLEYLLYIYKGFRFYYPPTMLPVEIVALTFLFVYELVRIHFGNHGNKIESTITIAWFLILVAPAIIGFVFYLRLQTYVLLIDAILGVTAIVFVALETIFGIFAFISFRTLDRLEQ